MSALFSGLNVRQKNQAFYWNNSDKKSSAGGQRNVTIRCGLNFKERFESELLHIVRFC